jgi:hypothetical protein
MLKTQLTGIPYHGWHIEVVRQNEEFLFRCYPPQVTYFCNNASTYRSFRMALVAARHFVNREVAVLALMKQTAAWFNTGKISEVEYWDLISFD